MSDTVEQHYVNAYNNAVTMLFQQQGSKLRGLVREKQSTSEYEFFERIHPTAATKRTQRHGPTRYANTIHSRRRAEKSDYDWADLIDKADLHRVLMDPTSSYATNGGWAMGRAFDSELILSFNADAIEGKTGGTTVPFPLSTQRVANGSLNMNWKKLIDGGLIFANNDVDSKGLACVISPSAVWSLLQQTEVSSIDFAGVKALVEGDVSSFAGFKFVKSTLLPKTGNIRSCFAWHPVAMGVGLGQEIGTSVDRLPQMQNSIQVMVEGAFGAVRVLDEGVVQFDIDESAGPAA